MAYGEYLIVSEAFAGDVLPGELEAQVLADFPGVRISQDKELLMYRDLAAGLGDWKVNTIRYKPDHVRIPFAREGDLWLPVIEMDPDDKEYRRPWGEVEIIEVAISSVEDFPEELAMAQGYAGVEDMKEGMAGIYRNIYVDHFAAQGGVLRPDEMLSCYVFGDVRPKA